jgi:hypothetical protein
MDSPLSMTEREDRLRLIIQGTLSETIRQEMEDVIRKPMCDTVHKALNTDREERGKAIYELKGDFKDFTKKCDVNFGKVDTKFNDLNKFIIATLLSSLGALILAVFNYFTKVMK